MVELRVLGTVSLATTDRRDVVSVLGQPRRLALLAYLAVATPRGPHRRDTLLAMFWPELNQPRARAALRQSLYVLRSALGPDVVETQGNEVVGLNFSAIRCDAVEFDGALKDGRWQEALDLYQGDLLEGFFISGAPEFEQWQDVTRRRLRDGALHSALALVEHAEASGDLATAAIHARRAVRLGPDDESVLRRLVTLLERLGDRAGALAAYEQFARRLATDYEAEPAAETQALAAAMRVRQMPVDQGGRPAIFAGLESRPRPRWSRRRLAFGTGLTAATALLLLVGLKMRSGHAHPQRLSSPPTANADAYDFYIRGKILLQQQTRQNDSVAITLVERAVAIDPAFAAAWAELSRAEALRVFQFVRGDSVAFERAQVAAERALRLNPDLAEAHHAEAYLLWWSPDPDWYGPGRFAHERAIAEDRRALVLDPSLDRAHHHLGNIYLHIGLLDQAITQLRQVLVISPRDDNALRRIAEARAYQGHYEEALRILSEVRPDAGSSFWHYEMAMILLHLGRVDSASTVIRAYLQAHPDDQGGVVTSARGVWHALAGDARHADQDIQSAVEKGKGYIHFHHAAYHIALTYALLHQPDSAVHWLRRVADGGMPCYPLFASDPFLNNIRNDAGFVTFLREQRAQWEHFRATL